MWFNVFFEWKCHLVWINILSWLWVRPSCVLSLCIFCILNLRFVEVLAFFFSLIYSCWVHIIFLSLSSGTSELYFFFSFFLLFPSKYYFKFSFVKSFSVNVWNGGGKQVTKGQSVPCTSWASRAVPWEALKFAGKELWDSGMTWCRSLK